MPEGFSAARVGFSAVPERGSVRREMSSAVAERVARATESVSVVKAGLSAPPEKLSAVAEGKVVSDFRAHPATLCGSTRAGEPTLKLSVTLRRSDAPTLRRSDAPTLRRSDAPTLRRSDAPTLRRSDAPTRSAVLALRDWASEFFTALTSSGNTARWSTSLNVFVGVQRSGARSLGYGLHLRQPLRRVAEAVQAHVELVHERQEHAAHFAVGLAVVVEHASAFDGAACAAYE